MKSRAGHADFLPAAPSCSINRPIARTKVLIVFAFVVTPGICVAQLPVGAIGGTICDSSGGVIPGAEIRVVSRGTRQARTATSGKEGAYNFPALLPGEYDVAVELAGFQRTVRTAIVEAGSTTTTDFTLRVGDLRDLVTVQGASPQMHFDSATVRGIVTHDQIEALPLNGRGFLELAKLEPGVQPLTLTNRNRTIVSVLGAPAVNVGGARFTVDGGSVTAVALGGAQMNLSQDVVQEFQIASVNFDLAAGLTDTGAVNVITRGGQNERRSSAFYFFRDHHLAAYPALRRDPSNPDPFFQRQQFGAATGGPIRHDRSFYFVSVERNDQQGVAGTTLSGDFAHLSRVASSPQRGTLFSARVDLRINSAHSLIVRHSYDGSRSFGPAMPGGTPAPNAYPSNWARLKIRADQTLAGLTSVLRPDLVNDLRVSAFRMQSATSGAGETDCRECLGLGAPSITVLQTDLVIGNSTSADSLERRLQLKDAITWHWGTHRVRAGIDWEQNRDLNLVWNNEPVSITLYSPDYVRARNSASGLLEAQPIPLPASFNTMADILALPVQGVIIGIGDPGVPQESGGPTRRWNTVWLYGEDAWHLHDRLTLTYGLGWGYDGVLNHDLRKPAWLAPILGADGLGPTRKNWTNFAPVAGLTWTPSSNRNTVVHIGAGRFFRTQGLTSSMDNERIALGPAGLVRQNFPGSSILNWLPGIPGLPVGAPLEFLAGPTGFTGADLMAMLPAIRARLSDTLANANRNIQQIRITKQASTPAVFPARVSDPSAVHLNVGVQQQLSPRTVVSVDVVSRHFVHVPLNGGAIDNNHFNRAVGPVIPRCRTAEASDPDALCSLGAINVQVAPYRFTYKGLIVRMDKRLSNGAQLRASYAWSRNSGTNAGNGFNLDDWLANRGPSGSDVTHIVNLSGVVRLPWQIDLGYNFSYSSAPPFSAYVGNIDFNGDGTKGDLLPGTSVNAFNRGMRRSDLERLVTQFNENVAGTKDAAGIVIPTLGLPADFAFGDNFQSLDLRLSRSFVIRARTRLSLIAEAFNVGNAANLSGYSGDLRRADFGQPTTRVTQVFGSGGPRAVQFAARLAF